MLSINTNLPSIIAQNSLKKSTLKLNTAIERMTTGYKINGAKDNAANYSIATNMSTKISAYQVAEDNISIGLDLVTTANENLDLIGDKLSRLRALAEQSSNGTYGTQSLIAINSEANAIIDEIYRTYANTEFNGIKLFAGNSVDESIGGQPLKPDSATSASTSAIAFSGVDEATTISDGTYAISTEYDLKKLADMTNAGKIEGGTFVLTQDIQFSYSGVCSAANWKSIGSGAYDFKGVFDGNGHTLTNFFGEESLFGDIAEGAEIKNLTVSSANIVSSGTATAILANFVSGKITGCNVSGTVRGFVGSSGMARVLHSGGVIDNCHADIEVTETGSANGYDASGVLVGSMDANATLINSSARGIMNGNSDDMGGLVGIVFENARVENCWSTVAIKTGDHSGVLYGWAQRNDDVKNCYTVETDLTKNWVNLSGNKPLDKTLLDALDKVLNNSQDVSAIEISNPYTMGLQVGINGGENSRISFDLSFALKDFSKLRGLGLDGVNYLEKIDNMVNSVSSKQTEFGAVQNRLESALDEISTQYDNLVSSRSTLRDADIAEVSSEYIRQQILQQASATLLSTANQTPALALQLL